MLDMVGRYAVFKAGTGFSVKKQARVCACMPCVSRYCPSSMGLLSFPGKASTLMSRAMADAKLTGRGWPARSHLPQLDSLKPPRLVLHELPRELNDLNVPKKQQGAMYTTLLKVQACEHVQIQLWLSLSRALRVAMLLSLSQMADLWIDSDKVP